MTACPQWPFRNKDNGDKASDLERITENVRISDDFICAHEIRARKDKRGADLISDVLPFGRLWYGDANAVANAISYAEHYSRSHDALIRVYDDLGNVIETHEYKGDFKEW